MQLFTLDRPYFCHFSPILCVRCLEQLLCEVDLPKAIEFKPPPHARPQPGRAAALPPPPRHVPFAKRWEGGGRHLGKGGLDEMVLSSFHQWGTHLSGFHPWGTQDSLTLTSAALNFLNSSSNLALSALTSSAGFLNWVTTQLRIWGVTPEKLQTPIPISRMACSSRAIGKAGGRTPNFSTLPRVRFIVMAALVCQATPKLGLNLAWTATQSLLFLVRRCR